MKVSRVEIQDIKPPDELRSAMEKQMRAERDRRAMILEAEGQKRSAILSAEGRKEAEITAAEGSKQAQILRAEGEAFARIRVAEAEAKAIETIRNTIGEKENAAGYLIAFKYIDALKQIATGDQTKVVFLPYESSSVLGALGSMKELLKETNEKAKSLQNFRNEGEKS